MYGFAYRSIFALDFTFVDWLVCVLLRNTWLNLSIMGIFISQFKQLLKPMKLLDKTDHKRSSKGVIKR